MEIELYRFLLSVQLCLLFILLFSVFFSENFPYISYKRIVYKLQGLNTSSEFPKQLTFAFT